MTKEDLHTKKKIYHALSSLENLEAFRDGWSLHKNYNRKQELDRLKYTPRNKDESN
jgi:hypothetical protein